MSALITDLTQSYFSVSFMVVCEKNKNNEQGEYAATVQILSRPSITRKPLPDLMESGQPGQSIILIFSVVNRTINTSNQLVLFTITTLHAEQGIFRSGTVPR